MNGQRRSCYPLVWDVFENTPLSQAFGRVGGVQWL